jgi:hypothetical protein
MDSSLLCSHVERVVLAIEMGVFQEEIINSADIATWQEDRWLQDDIEFVGKIDEKIKFKKMRKKKLGKAQT